MIDVLFRPSPISNDHVLPSAVLGPFLERIKVAEHTQLCNRYRRSCAKSLRPGRLIEKVNEGLAHLRDNVVKLGGLNPDRIRACSRSPKGTLLDGSSEEMYRQLTAVWSRRPGLKRVEAYTRRENEASLLSAIDATRSEALSAELILTNVYLDLPGDEAQTWQSESTLIEEPHRRHPCYLARASYNDSLGRKVHLCIPVIGFWMASEQEVRIDQKTIVRLLDQLKMSAECDGGTVQIWRPEVSLSRRHKRRRNSK